MNRLTDTGVFILSALLTLMVLFWVADARADEQRRPELTPVQKAGFVWSVANAATAIVFGIPVYLGATVAGKQKELCDVMKGRYDPTAPDICAGGDWVRVIPYLPKPDR